MNCHHSYHKWHGPIKCEFPAGFEHVSLVQVLGSWVQNMGYEQVLKGWRIHQFPDI